MTTGLVLGFFFRHAFPALSARRLRAALAQRQHHAGAAVQRHFSRRNMQTLRRMTDNALFNASKFIARLPSLAFAAFCDDIESQGSGGLWWKKW